jgi:hypothetical protein
MDDRIEPSNLESDKQKSVNDLLLEAVQNRNTELTKDLIGQGAKVRDVLLQLMKSRNQEASDFLSQQASEFKLTKLNQDHILEVMSNPSVHLDTLVNEYFNITQRKTNDLYQRQLNQATDEKRNSIDGEMPKVEGLGSLASLFLPRRKIFPTDNVQNCEEVSRRIKKTYPRKVEDECVVEQNLKILSEEINLTGNDNNQHVDVEGIGENTTDMHSID